MIYKTHYKSPIGDLLLASKEGKLIGLWIEGQKYYKSNFLEEMEENENEKILHPISIIIPCHRVIATNGDLTGYAGGIDKKIYLLEHEKL